MTAVRVEKGDKVIVHGDPRTHVVTWENYRAWDSACGQVIEDYQPSYYEELLDVDADAMRARLGDDLELPPFHASHPALQLQVAPDDAPITCLLCLAAHWKLGDAEEGALWDADDAASAPD